MPPPPGVRHPLAGLLLLAALLPSCHCLSPTAGPVRNGTLCTEPSDCASGFCSAGLCCESACDTPCLSCGLPGEEGRCLPAPENTDPAHACGEGTCAGTCDGQGACRYPGGETSCGYTLCVGGAVQSAACDGQGGCGLHSKPCAPYACKAGACLTQCSVPLECAGAATCKPGGTCVDRLPAGSPCGAGSACASNLCADNVCCDQPCGGACESCALTDSKGICTAIPAGQDPNNECPKAGLCGATCNGQRACAYAPAGTSCGAVSCSLPDSPLLSKVCNGAGACLDTQTSCGTFACLAGACGTTCTTDAQCRSNAWCSAGACVPRRPLGEACARAEECDSQLCVEGVCCSSACASPCDTCAGASIGLCSPIGAGGTPAPACAAGQGCGPGAQCPATCSSSAPCLAGFYCNAGTCTQKLATAALCGDDGECSTGFCSNGVCCESNCDNQPCRSCNTLGGPGSCLPLAWSDPGGCPAGALYACRADGVCASGPCADDRDCKAAGYCAGASGCVARLDGGVNCGRDRECAANLLCVDGVCCSSGCDGGCQACNLAGSRGTCTPIPTRQDPAAECGGALSCSGASACYASCTTYAQCESGNVCLAASSACIPGNPLGAACTGPEQCASNNCFDGVCCDIPCSSPCRSCELAGMVGTCTAMPVNTDPDDECLGGLTCNGAPLATAACRTNCTSSAQCEQGYGCASGTCALLRALGDSCANGSQCQSGQCFDAVCCNTTCAAPCQACNFPGNVGACQPMAAGTDPRTQCGSGTCNGLGGCGTSCALDSQCSPTSFCNVSACAPRRTNGQGCTAPNQCLSGLCVDGVCCSTACGLDCQSCNVPGRDGGCSNFDAGTDPENECLDGLACNGAAACNTGCTGQAQCERPYWCQGGACVPDLDAGVSCGASDQCRSGNCTDAFCCGTACAGACQSCDSPGLEGTCTPYPVTTDPEPECGYAWCSGGFSCFLPCTGDAQCKPGNYCDSAGWPRQCLPKKADGVGCTGGNQCTSGNCIDGFCCDTACTEACDSCGLLGTIGTCTNRPAGATGTPSCTPFLCGGAAACPTTCSLDAHCVSGRYCDGTTCLPKQANGTVCTAPNQCNSGNCVDGYCCNAPCAADCNACNLATLGTCLNRAAGSAGSPSCSPFVCTGGAACPSTCSNDLACASGYYCNGTTCVIKKSNGLGCTGSNQCTSGNCVDGYCCNTPCTGSCNACNLSPLGTCQFQPGGYPGTPTCSPYECPGNAATCRPDCGSDSECVPTYWCSGTNRCVADLPAGAACSRDQQCANGSCLNTNPDVCN